MTETNSPVPDRPVALVDVAVLNVGVASEQPPDLPLDLERYRRVLGVNIDGPAFGVDAAVPELARHGGRILVTASLAGLGPEQANPLYALTKSPAVGYVRAIAASPGYRGVSINTLPTTLMPDGTPAQFRPFLSEAPKKEDTP